MFKGITTYLVRAGVIAALYVVLSLAILPLASGAIQLRLSEALTILPVLFSEAVPAVFVGCLVVNLISGAPAPDIILGSAITLVAAILTCVLSKRIKNISAKLFVGGIFPVVLNAFLLPLIWQFYIGTQEYIYIVQAVLLLISQSIAVYAVGVPLALSVVKLKQKNKLQ